MESEPLYKLKAEFFKTLGHPARIRILELLAVQDRAVAEMLPEVGLGRRICPSGSAYCGEPVSSRLAGSAARSLLDPSPGVANC